MKEDSFKFIDLFAGVGGMRIPFDEIGGKCVFSSEKDHFAQKTYFHNFGEWPHGDITEIDPASIPDHDLIIAGFPCQPFSFAGKRLGLSDSRGTLFNNIIKIMKAKLPGVVLLENVKGLIPHDKGNTLRTILRELTNTGYKCNIPRDVIFSGSEKDLKQHAKKMVLNAKDFGVPQNRERIFIVLWRNELIKNFEYPVGSKIKTRVFDVLEDLDEETRKRLTLTDQQWEYLNYKAYRANFKRKYGLINKDTAYSKTIDTHIKSQGIQLISQNNDNPRSLSVREAARLQGFYDSFEFPVSRTQADKQIGNGVAIPVVREIAKKLKPWLIQK